MADLVVKPAYVMGPTDILTVDKFNLMATPIVELSIADRVDDQSFLRNGNFYSSFWTTPAGMNCPPGVQTSNADYWFVNPTAAAVTCLRTILVPDLYSLFGMEIQGNAGATDVYMKQDINGDLSATLRRTCTFSGYIYSGAGLAISPRLNLYTATTFNGGTYTLQATEDLQTCANGLWTYVSVSFDLTNMPNVANGLRVAVWIPSGALSATTKNVVFSRLKLQIGELATEFVDDVGLFIQTPSVDSTMLQDGCIARPALFMPNVVPTGAYQAKSINNGDINDGAIGSRTMVQNTNTTLSLGFTQPAVGVAVPITVGSTTGFIAGHTVTIAGGGSYTIVSPITDATHMSVINTGASGNAAPNASVPAGGAVHQNSAVIDNLGYTPVNKAGDTLTGQLHTTLDTVFGGSTYVQGALLVSSTSANANNAGYMPTIGFERPGVAGRAIGLGNDSRFYAPLAGLTTRPYLLDSYFGVATADIQNGAVTIPKIGADVIALVAAPGMVQMFAGPGPPSGWFVCNGQAISRTIWVNLFAAIGTYWGGGDGTTTFNVPDFRGRSPLGYVDSGGSGLTGRGFATKGGEEAHQLSIAEMPGHDHGWRDNGHTHGASEGQHTHTFTNPVGTTIGVVGGANQIFYPSGSANTGGGGGTVSISAANANISFTGQGGWGAHNVMHPFAVLYFIIKA